MIRTPPILTAYVVHIKHLSPIGVCKKDRKVANNHECFKIMCFRNLFSQFFMLNNPLAL